MKKILIVDDDTAFILALKDCLENEDYEIFTACDGFQGFELYQQQEPDLVITDLIMPNEDGMGLILNIGQQNFPCKVIVISGGGRIGAHDYLAAAKRLPQVYQVLEKPFKMDDLLDSIENLRRDITQQHA